MVQPDWYSILSAIDFISSMVANGDVHYWFSLYLALVNNSLQFESEWTQIGKFSTGEFFHSKSNLQCRIFTTSGFLFMTIER
jgi:hypothetical protein